MKARFPRAHSLRPPAACPPLARPAARRRLKPRLTAPGSRPRPPQPASPSSCRPRPQGPRRRRRSLRHRAPGGRERPIRRARTTRTGRPPPESRHAEGHRCRTTGPADRPPAHPGRAPPSRAVGGRRAPSGTRSGGRRDGLGKNRGDGSIGSTDGIRAGDGSDAIRSRGAGCAHRCSFRSQPRATTVLDAWARGRTIMESMLTWAGRSSAQVMHSAMSCALRGPSTPA